MLIKSITNNVNESVKGLHTEDQLFIDCLCEMLENVEKQSRFSTNPYTISQLKMHSEVIGRVIENNLLLKK